MKKTARIATVALCSILSAQCFCMCGCSAKDKNNDGSEVSVEGLVAGESLSSQTAVKLTNHMTAKELDSVTEGPLTVLDEPWNKVAGSNEKLAAYQDGVYFEICEKEDVLRDIEEHPETYAGWTDEELEEYKANCTSYIRGFVVDGRHYGTMISLPLEDVGMYGWYYVLEGDTLVCQELMDLQDLKDKLPQILEEYRKDKYQYFFFGTDFDEEMWKEDIVRIFEAKENKSYQELPSGTCDQLIDEYYQNLQNQQFDLSWELDKEKIETIKDQVTEYTFYDEELDRKLVVHVAIPKGCESARKALAGDGGASASDGVDDAGDLSEHSALPALVLTDAVWRFNDIEKLLKEMEEGRAKPQILISIGQDYNICNSDNMERSALFCEGKDKFLDFITDNLMPYLGEIYAIDYENSTLFGHSLGGVFAHYALCNSDLYENQPFGCYIIGSPAFWSPYSREMSDYSQQANDYGYLDRNDSVSKRVFITAGSDEDVDYEEYFEDGDSTTQSIVHLAERINAKCDPSSPMAKDKLYKSHHYQYIPDMLIEYVDGTF
ncbi:MAG: hypothetical protein J5636_00745 [Clostridiales bacterium]|nr:hypothetical protein [Clostridiales bacterium]